MSRKLGAMNNFYAPLTAETLYRLTLLGVKMADICALFSMDDEAFHRRLSRDKAMAEAYYRGGLMADATVAARLYLRACGYSHPEEKVVVEGGVSKIVVTTKHYPPDTGAAIYWLNNRQKDLWEQTLHLDAKSRRDLDNAIDSELERMAALEEKGPAGEAAGETG